MTIKELKEALAKSNHCSDLDLQYHLTEKGITDDKDAETVREYLMELIDQEEVLYYGSAMEFLMQHDASLTESLSLAHDMGYTTDKLNSELLATILLQDLMRDELDEIYN
jgi:hypothetical protein